MIVVIGNNQWECSVASTTAELTSGLSNIASLPAFQGMFFDMGTVYSRIDINMQEMLFPLDIVFIGDDMTVVGVLHDVQPGDEAYFEATTTPGARYFVEGNAGEAIDVNVGDLVSFQGYTPGQTSLDMNSVMTMMMMVMMMGAMTKMVK